MVLPFGSIFQSVCLQPEKTQIIDFFGCKSSFIHSLPQILILIYNDSEKKIGSYERVVFVDEPGAEKHQLVSFVNLCSELLGNHHRTPHCLSKEYPEDFYRTQQIDR